jgi:hypothetical protein
MLCFSGIFTLFASNVEVTKGSSTRLGTSREVEHFDGYFSNFILDISSGNVSFEIIPSPASIIIVLTYCIVFFKEP